MSISQRNVTSSSPPKPMPHYPSFQSHVRPERSSPSPSSSTNDAVPTKKNALSEFGEDEYAKFSVTYVGSATQDWADLTQDSIDDALRLFELDGMAGGRAAIVKNVIDLQISPLGINLTDNKQKLFVHRNYPLRTISGYCRHETDSKLFAFASYRPGFSKIQKVHVFRCGTEPVDQIMAATKYWLKMDPSEINQ